MGLTLKGSTAKQGPNVAVKGKLSENRPNQKQTLYDNKPNHTHTHTGKSTLYILKLSMEGKKPVETSNCNEEQTQ